MKFASNTSLAFRTDSTRLMNEHDRQELKGVGFRGKRAISTFGEFTYSGE
jgi:hypothetical protein